MEDRKDEDNDDSTGIKTLSRSVEGIKGHWNPSSADLLSVLLISIQISRTDDDP